MKMMVSLKYFVVGFLLISLDISADGCTCVGTHEQVRFCNGMYAMKFDVVNTSEMFLSNNGQYLDAKTSLAEAGYNTSEMSLFEMKQSVGMITSNYKYQVSILEIYQGESELSALNLTYFYTETSEAACGMHLKNGATYFLIGGAIYFDQTFHISLCDHLVSIDGMHEDERNFVELKYKNLYRSGCSNCIVHDCYTWFSCLGNVTTGMACDASTLPLEDYYGSKAVCLSTEDFTCGWIVD